MSEERRNDPEWIAMKNKLILDFIMLEKENIKLGNKNNDKKMVEALCSMLMKKMGGAD